MLILSLESSTSQACVGLFDGSSELALIHSLEPKRHSEFFNLALDQCLSRGKKSWPDVDLIAVGIGPGSFTGIRVAVNVARTLCYSLKKPIFATTSLDVLHLPARIKYPDHAVLTLINAYKNMVYLALFAPGDQNSKAQAIPAIDLEKFLDSVKADLPVICVGDGFGAYQHLFSTALLRKLRRDSSLSDFPEASALANLVQKSIPTMDWKSIIPLYVRASAAEENFRGS